VVKELQLLLEVLDLLLQLLKLINLCATAAMDGFEVKKLDTVIATDIIITTTGNKDRFRFSLRK
jgi:hypothetical protein